MKLFEGTTWIISLVGSGIVFLLGLIGYGIKTALQDLKTADNKNQDDIKEHDRRMDKIEVHFASLESGQRQINESISREIKDIKEMLTKILDKL